MLELISLFNLSPLDIPQVGGILFALYLLSRYRGSLALFLDLQNRLSELEKAGFASPSEAKPYVKKPQPVTAVQLKAFTKVRTSHGEEVVGHPGDYLVTDPLGEQCVVRADTFGGNV